MINIRKSEKIPACLAKTKDYKCCIEQIQEEFFHKCYLCENNGLMDIQTEHFNPDKSLRLDWKNLFYSCGHCNGIKSNTHIEILNPTDFSTIITDVISFNLNPIPKEKPVFTALNGNSSVIKTVDLLTEIHNPKTTTRKLQAHNLNELIGDEINKFTTKILKFYNSNSPERKSEIKNQVKNMLHFSSKFLAYKIWIIKSDNERLKDFEDILPVFN